MVTQPTIPAFFKDPLATLDFGFDLSPAPTALIKPWLAQGEEITSLNVVPDDGITVNNDAINTNSSGMPNALLVAWISGGTIGETYNVKFEFSTNQNRTDTRSLSITVVQR